MTDPEPDRIEAASRPSSDWDRAALIAPILDLGESIFDALGCKGGLHEFEHVFIGDPPGPDRKRLAWARDRVYCKECGQTATLILDPPPVRLPVPDSA